MGASNKAFLEVRIRAEMSEETYCSKPKHLIDEMTIKSISDEGFKEEYKKSPVWVELNKQIGQFYKERTKLEEAIRNENR